MQATTEWIDTNFYEVLGVEPTATTKQIKAAYRKLARSNHPDANPDDSGAEGRFSDIAKAYEVLRDEKSRAEYDAVRLQASRPPVDVGYGPSGYGSSAYGRSGFDPGQYVDLEDLFGDYFAQQQAQPRRGADVSASLALGFTDAVRGLTTTLVVDGRSINVRIPSGVNDGQTIRLAGKGAPGINGGPDGDLLIRVDVAPHHRFGRAGNNLTVEVPVRYEDVVLGADISVPTLDGPPVTVRVPPGTANGAKLRVKGKGVSTKADDGDLLVTVSIDVPRQITAEERALLEQLRELRQL